MRIKLWCKLLLAALILAVLLPGSGNIARADGNYRIVIEDDAMLLTANERSRLENDMAPILAYGNVGFKTVDFNRYTTSIFAEDWYQQTFGLTDGTCFVIDMDNRQIYIYSMDGVYRYLTDIKAETITDNVYRYASRGEYYECAKSTFEQMFTVLEGGRIAEPMKYISNALLALVIALLLNFLFVRRVTEVREPKPSSRAAHAQKYFTSSPAIVTKTGTTKTYSPVSSGSSGGSGGGGGHSGGGGGGGHSGGGGGHGF